MRRNKLILLIIAYSAFVALGAFDGLLGVAWPSLRETFGLPLDALGLLLLASTAGHITASFANGRFITRYGTPALLITSTLFMSGGRLAQILSPAWILVVLAGFAAGFGMGMLDAGLNTYAATHFRARLLNWLHASFGAGTMLGSLLMTAVLTLNFGWRTGFAVLAAMQALLLVAFSLTRGRWELRPADDHTPDDALINAAGRETLRLPALWLSVGIFFLYTGIELGVGQWSFSLLTEARGLPEATAGLWTSLYWGSFTAGRVILGFIETNLTRLVRLSLAGVIAGAVLLWLNPAPWLGLLGLALIGFALAPTFPALIALTPQRLGRRHAPNAIGFQIGAAGFGAAILPATAGVLADSLGLETIPLFMLAAAGLLFALHEIALRREMRTAAVAATLPSSD